jgi:hypothetical protein
MTRSWPLLPSCTPKKRLKDAQHDAEQDHDGEVGGDQQADALEHGSSLENRCAARAPCTYHAA